MMYATAFPKPPQLLVQIFHWPATLRGEKEIAADLLFTLRSMPGIERRPQCRMDQRSHPALSLARFHFPTRPANSRFLQRNHIAQAEPGMQEHVQNWAHALVVCGGIEDHSDFALGEGERPAGIGC